MKLIIFDGWDIILAAFCFAALCFALCEHAARKSAKEVERLYAPVMEFALKWSEIHPANEEAASLYRDGVMKYHNGLRREND